MRKPLYPGLDLPRAVADDLIRLGGQPPERLAAALVEVRRARGTAPDQASFQYLGALEAILERVLVAQHWVAVAGSDRTVNELRELKWRLAGD